MDISTHIQDVMGRSSYQNRVPRYFSQSKIENFTDFDQNIRNAQHDILQLITQAKISGARNCRREKMSWLRNFRQPSMKMVEAADKKLDNL